MEDDEELGFQGCPIFRHTHMTQHYNGYVDVNGGFITSEKGVDMKAV